MDQVADAQVDVDVLARLTTDAHGHVLGAPLDPSLEVPGGGRPTNGPPSAKTTRASTAAATGSDLDALAWARARVGTTESPANSNKGPGSDGITAWEVDSGYPWVTGAAQGVAWCQCFANAVAVHGGAPQLHTGFTPAVLAGIGDFNPIAVSSAAPGDFIFFKWPGVSSNRCDHVGVHLSHTATTVTCIEGNTSPTDSGSQNNGGGVWVKTRSRLLVAGAISVPYLDDAYRNLLLGMVGADVRAFQVATNKRADGCGRPDRRCDVDGTYGSETKENGAWAAYILGIGDSTDDIKSGGISAYVQNLVRNPDERNDEQIARAGPRRAANCNK